MSSRVLSSCALAVACLAGSSVLAGATQQGQAAKPPDAQEVIAAGCLIRQTADATGPTTGHESESAHGLALAKATLVNNAAAGSSTTTSSAVPGSRPSATGSGTGGAQPPASTAAGTGERGFWIAGPRGGELSRYVGQHVEVTGTLQQQPDANRPGTAATVGTAGTRANDTATTAARPGTPADSSSSRTAHPSAPTQTINVTSFKVDGGICP